MRNFDAVLKLASAKRLAANGHGREVRRAAGLSLHDMAAPIGVADATLYRWENGQRKPTGQPAVAWVELIADLERANDVVP